MMKDNVTATQELLLLGKTPGVCGLDDMDPFALPDLPAVPPRKVAGHFGKATRTAFANVRMLPSERIRLAAAAKRAGYSDVSSWARGVLLAAATGEDSPRLDDGAASEIARLRRDLNSGIGANLNQAMLHANTMARGGSPVDETGLAIAVMAARHALEVLQADIQKVLRPHGRK